MSWLLNLFGFPWAAPRDLPYQITIPTTGLEVIEVDYEGKRHAFLKRGHGLSKIGEYPIPPAVR
jgi:hypothetical protein